VSLKEFLRIEVRTAHFEFLFPPDGIHCARKFVFSPVIGMSIQYAA
jgi:hypothetical protein